MAYFNLEDPAHASLDHLENQFAKESVKATSILP